MQINFQSQNNKINQFFAPGAEGFRPNPYEEKKDKTDKPVDKSKPDYSDKKSRDLLYKNAEAAISKLKMSSNDASKKLAKEIASNLKIARDTESAPKSVADLKEYQKFIADVLQKSLDEILAKDKPKANFVQIPEVTIEGVDPNKKVTAKKTEGPVISPDGSNVVFDEDKITVPKSNPTLAKAPEITGKTIDAPKPALTYVAAGFPPNNIRISMRNTVASSGFTGEKYVETTDGKIWQATITGGKDGGQSVIKWKKADKLA